MTRRGTTLAAGVCLIALSACSTQGGGGTTTSERPLDGAAGTSASQSASSAATSASPTAEPVTVTSNPADGAQGVRPDKPVTVSASGGTVRDVALTDVTGKTVAGRIANGTWTSTARLRPSATYSLAITSERPDGSTQQDTRTFRTLKPAVTATYHVLYDGQTVGIGAPATIQFDSAVTTPALRRAIEKNAVVTTYPKVEGSWGWLDNRQLMWRPKAYWKPGTKVQVKANLGGLQTGDSKWVKDDKGASFAIGSAMISHVDIANHTMTVTRDGQTLRTIPISAGSGAKPEFVTRSGTKVIIEKSGDITMDSETVGIKKDDPNYYKVETKYNLRVTWTGEFLHSAPWSIGAQGSANVSHGCINIRPTQAQWMFENSKVGDIITFSGSNRPFLPTDGIGVWTYTYDQWKKQSALATPATT